MELVRMAGRGWLCGAVLGAALILGTSRDAEAFGRLRGG